MQFETIHDANLYLSGSFVKLNSGKVVKVDYVNSEGDVYCTFSDGEYSSVGLDDISEEFIELGYYHFDGRFSYLQRTPSRQWRFGLTSSNLVEKPSNYTVDLIIGGSLHQALDNRSFVTPDECFLKSKEDGGVILSKDMLLTYEGYLEYKTHIIGSFDGESISLLNIHKYFKNVVEEIFGESFRII